MNVYIWRLFFPNVRSPNSMSLASRNARPDSDVSSRFKITGRLEEAEKFTPLKDDKWDDGVLERVIIDRDTHPIEHERARNYNCPVSKPWCISRTLSEIVA